jgi:hypothetical protein
MLLSIADGWSKIGGFVVVMCNDYFERLVIDHAATQVGFKVPGPAGPQIASNPDSIQQAAISAQPAFRVGPRVLFFVFI